MIVAALIYSVVYLATLVGVVWLHDSGWVDWPWFSRGPLWLAYAIIALGGPLLWCMFATWWVVERMRR